MLGVKVANRSRSELRELIGPFESIIPVPLRFSPSLTVREALHQVNAVLVASEAGTIVPLDEMRDALRPALSAPSLASPVFIFELSNTPLTRMGSPELRLPEILLSRPTVRNSYIGFEISVSLRDEEGGIKGTAEYAADLFDDRTIARLLESWGSILASITANPGQRVRRLPIIPPNEYQGSC
jgi:non-ribosomal peptide synthetase component F